MAGVEEGRCGDDGWLELQKLDFCNKNGDFLLMGFWMFVFLGCEWGFSYDTLLGFEDDLYDSSFESFQQWRVFEFE